ncbi:MAG: SPOR domain-containing protein [Gammaproteobacteria bacterium]|nr:SPOR domain-containing protein [Gammaproteobacteria bacterium]
MSFNLPERPTVDYSANGVDDANLLRRRLLGAAVLIALAVIFLPLLLDGSGTESRFRRVEQLRVEPPRIIDSEGRIEVPPKPVISSQAPAAEEVKTVAAPADPSPKPEPVVEVPAAATPEPVTIALPTEPSTPVETAAPAVVETPSAAAAVTGTTPAPAAAATGNVQNLVAWVVQAGSFSSEANALSLRDRLRQAGFPAFVSPSTTDSDLFRVKVGPITDQEKATDVQSKVQALLGYKTLVRQYK